jgi:hypothetical protein
VRNQYKVLAEKYYIICEAEDTASNDFDPFNGYIYEYSVYSLINDIRHWPHAKEFIDWLKDPSRSKLTTNKIQNVLDHIGKNKGGFVAVFKIANMLVDLKYKLKDQLDSHASQGAAVTASVREHPGHEGFVADTPHGKIKLVNRPVFMKKV